MDCAARSSTAWRTCALAGRVPTRNMPCACIRLRQSQARAALAALSGSAQMLVSSEMRSKRSSTAGSSRLLALAPPWDSVQAGSMARTGPLHAIYIEPGSSACTAGTARDTIAWSDRLWPKGVTCWSNLAMCDSAAPAVHRARTFPHSCAGILVPKHSQ